MNFETRLSRQADDQEFYSADGTAKKRPWAWIIVGILIALAALALAYFAFGRNSKAGTPTSKEAAAGTSGKDDKQAPHVTVVVPGQQLVENVISATGTLAARQEMPVGAVGEGGMVVRVLVQPGHWVHAGQVLAIVDRQVQNQQSNQIAAQIGAAQAEARLAQSELDRSVALQSRGFVSKADLQRKTATRDGALARVRVAQAQFGEIHARIGRLDIRAPAAGLVLTRAVEPGQVVGAGAGVLFRIAQGGQMEMKAQLSESDLAKMHVGIGAKVIPVGTTTEFNGQVWQVSPVIDPQSRQGTVRIAVAYNSALRPGGFAAAKIIAGAASAPMLPETAIQSDKGGNYLFILTPDNKVERRDVVVGTVTDKGASILTGLNGQERVVLSAGAFLNPGEVVVPNLVKPAS
jgi:HlyD family secretion protein